MPTESGHVTQLLLDWQAGDERARDRLVDALYEELRSIARRHLRKEAAGHTINTTGLVHEAYLGLVRGNAVSSQGRAHFLATASRVMRHILIDHARSRAASKHGGDRVRVPLTDDVPGSPGTDSDLLDLDQALSRLETHDPRMAHVVECRFFGGMTLEETADAIGTSQRTVRREWTRARAWLFRELGDAAPQASGSP